MLGFMEYFGFFGLSGNQEYKTKIGASKQNEYQNFITTELYFNQIVNYSLNVYKWINMPKEIDLRFLELCLQFNGKGCMFKDSVNGKYMFLQVNQNGPLDVYRNPTKFTAFGINGYSRDLTNEDGVICYNNYTRMPNIWKLWEFAERIADVQRTIDVNLTLWKMPAIYRTSNKKLFSFKNFVNKILNNEVAIFVDEGFTPDGMPLTVINHNVDYVIDKLEIEKKQLWNECMLFIGIDNSNQDKKERMITDEVNANNGQVEQSRYIGLDARREFCEKVNEMFGLDIWCEFRHNEDKTTSENQEENETFENEEEVISNEREEVKKEKEVIKNE